MKNIILILLSVVCFTSCKKSTPAPATPNQPVALPPPNNPPIINSVTPFDTTGKTKMFFFFQLMVTHTQPYDFRNTANNVRIYYNDSLLSYHAGYDTNIVNGVVTSVDLVTLANFDITPDGISQPDMPLWVSNLDSLVIECDTTEYSIDLIYGANPYHFSRLTLKYKNNKVPFDSRQIWNQTVAPNNNTGTDLDLGWATNNQGSTQAAVFHWFLSPVKYRQVYVFQF